MVRSDQGNFQFPRRKQRLYSRSVGQLGVDYVRPEGEDLACGGKQDRQGKHGPSLGPVGQGRQADHFDPARKLRLRRCGSIAKIIFPGIARDDIAELMPPSREFAPQLQDGIRHSGQFRIELVRKEGDLHVPFPASCRTRSVHFRTSRR